LWCAVPKNERGELRIMTCQSFQKRPKWRPKKLLQERPQRPLTGKPSESDTKWKTLSLRAILSQTSLSG
jgi:hypothetical protein